MPSIRVDFKHVRANASFEKVAEHYQMTLAGKGDQRASLCTFHDEDTPSLKINVVKNIFHCFGCEAHGNILDFVTLMEGGDPNNDSDIRKGALTLAEMCGIEPTAQRHQAANAIKSKSPLVAKPRTTATKTVKEEVASAPPTEKRSNKPLSFALKLDASHPYLAERQLSQQIIETFGLGVADRGLMKGRMAIPIHNQAGSLIAYAGRWAASIVPPDTPKYLLPDGFQKQLVLFNLHRLTESAKRVVIVESYFSVFKLHVLGIPVVSSMGHSVSEAQCALLKDRGCEFVYLLFDGDLGGAQGIADSAPLLARQFFVNAPPVPVGFKPHRSVANVVKEFLKF